MANLFKINRIMCILICFLTFLCGCGNRQNEAKADDFQCDLNTTSTVDRQKQSLGDKLSGIINEVEYKKLKLAEAEEMAKHIINNETNIEAINDEMTNLANDMLNDIGSMPSSPAALMSWTEHGYDDYYAIKRKILWHLINKGTYFDEYDDERLVRRLVAAGEPSFVELLIKKGVNLTEYEGILLQAANSFNLNTLKLVYALITDVNYQNEKGTSVLMEAVRSHACYLDVPRSEEVVRFLLDNGANVNLRDKDGNSALTFAVQDGNCVPTPSAQKANENILKMILQSGINLNFEPKTLLHKATLGRNKKVVKLLLDQGLDIEQEDCAGQTPLHWASGAEAFKYHNWADPQMMKFLLKHGSNPNARDKYGNTPLISHVICQSQFHKSDISSDAIFTLIKFGADVSIKNNEGKVAKDYMPNPEELEDLERSCGWFEVFKANEILDRPVKNAHLALAPNFGPLIKHFRPTGALDDCRCCHCMLRNADWIYVYLEKGPYPKVKRKLFKIDENVSIYYPEFSDFENELAQEDMNNKLKMSFTKTWNIRQNTDSIKRTKQYDSCDFDLWQRNNLITIMKKEFTIADGEKNGEDKQKSYFIDAKSGKFYKAKDLFKKDVNFVSTIGRLVCNSIESSKECKHDDYQKFPFKNNFILTHEGLEVYFDRKNAEHHGKRVFKIKFADLDWALDKEGEFYKAFAGEPDAA